MALQALGIQLTHIFYECEYRQYNIILFDNITLQIKQLNVGFYFLFNDFIYEVYST